MRWQYNPHYLINIECYITKHGFVCTHDTLPQTPYPMQQLLHQPNIKQESSVLLFILMTYTVVYNINALVSLLTVCLAFS